MHTKDFPGGSVVKNLPAMQEPQETRVRSLGQEDPLEEGMAAHSSILAWRIPWTEHPGGLQPMGSQTVKEEEVCTKSFQSCPVICDGVDCSPPDSSVHGILQARILEWVAMPSSGGSS